MALLFFLITGLFGIQPYFQCGDDTVISLLKFGLWPATPTKPKMAFTLQYMRLVSSLVLDCSIPLNSVNRALQRDGKV